jgi:hypothetical protein
MNLTPEQKHEVAAWVAAGDNLSTVQKKIFEQFKISITYRDVRFLVDDLDLTLKDPAPKADASDLSKTAAAKAPAVAPGAAGGAGDPEAPLELEDEDAAAGVGPDDPLAPGLGGHVTVAVDKVTLIPGAMASGTVTFGDGVTGKWIVDNYGRPGFTEVSKPGYRPTPADAQAFMQELSLALQGKGL